MREDLRTTTEGHQTLASGNPEVAMANNGESLKYEWTAEKAASEAIDLARPAEQIAMNKLPPRMGEVAHGAAAQQPNPERPLTASEVISKYTEKVMGLRQKYYESFEPDDKQSNYGLAA